MVRRWKYRSTHDHARRTRPINRTSGQAAIFPAARIALSASPVLAAAPGWFSRPAAQSAGRLSDEARMQSRRCVFLPIGTEKLVQFGVADQAGKAVELAITRDFGGDADESMHGDSRERAADADAAHAHRPAVEKIDRLRRHRFHHGLDLLAGLDARRIETVSASILIGAKPANDVVEIGNAADEAFGPRREHDVTAGAINRGARSLDAGHRDVDSI